MWFGIMFKIFKRSLLGWIPETELKYRMMELPNSALTSIKMYIRIQSIVCYLLKIERTRH